MCWESVYALVPWFSTATQRHLEAAVYAALTPAKFSFFLVALYIVTRNLEDLHPSLKRAKLKRGGPPASADEIVEEFGHRVEARICEICLRIPGQSDAQVVWRSMVDGKVHAHKVEDLPSPKSSLVGRVLAEGRPFRLSRVSANPEQYLDRHDKSKEMVSTLTVPIRTRIGPGSLRPTSRSNDAQHEEPVLPVIGALSLEWDRKVPITRTRELQVQRVADQHAPFFEKERELAAIALLARRSALEEARQDAADLDGRLTSLVNITQDLLDAIGTHIRIDLGFSVREVVSDRSSPATIVPPGTLMELRCQDNENGIKSLRASLSISKGSNTWTARVGVLALRVPSLTVPVADPNRPILGTRRFTRQLIASVLADAVLDSVRSTFARTLKQVERRIGDSAIRSSGQWYSALNTALAGEGLCWVGARESKSGPILWFEKLLPGLESIVESTETAVVYRNITVFSCAEPFYGARSIVEIPLPGLEEGGRLWVGIERADFGIELEEPPSPWRGFLERLADTSATALTRVQARTEFGRMAKEALQAQSLITTNEMFHEVTKHLKRFRLELNLLRKELAGEEEAVGARHAPRIDSLSEQIERLWDLSEAFSQRHHIGRERPVALRNVANVVEAIQQWGLTNREATLTLDIPSDLPPVDVSRPFMVLAFSNLVTNSLAAGPVGVEMTLTAELAGADKVRCIFADNGPGIPDEIADPFELGKSGTLGRSGMGLWLTRQSLKHERCEIRLTERCRPGAVFELLLPAARNYTKPPGEADATREH